MSYFEHEYISNSDLKAFKRQIGGASMDEPLNLQKIFDLGTLIHQTILEPHFAFRDGMDEEVKLALSMRDTFFKDELCRQFIMAPDFQREHEFYSPMTVGPYTINARAKADGYRSKVKFFLELKGLAVETEKAFKESLDRMDYDQGIVHYMLTSKCDLALIVGISKKRPERLFKKIVKKHDDFYAMGEQKLIDILGLLHQYSPQDFIKQTT